MFSVQFGSCRSCRSCRRQLSQFGIRGAWELESSQFGIRGARKLDMSQFGIRGAWRLGESRFLTGNRDSNAGFHPFLTC